MPADGLVDWSARPPCVGWVEVTPRWQCGDTTLLVSHHRRGISEHLADSVVYRFGTQLDHQISEDASCRVWQISRSLRATPTLTSAIPPVLTHLSRRSIRLIMTEVARI